MSSVAVALGYVTFAAILLSALSIAVGWMVSWLAIGRATERTTVTTRLVWLGTVQWVFSFAHAIGGVLATLWVLEDLGGALLVATVTAGLGAGVATAQVVPLAHFDVYTRLGYGSPRETAITLGIIGSLLGGAVPLGLVLATAVSFAVVPIGALATYAYVALGAVVIGRLNRTDSLPNNVAERCARLAQTTDRPIRFRLLVDDDSPTAIASGAWPATPTVFIPDRLLEDLEPAEIDAIVAHEIGHIHHRDLDRAGLEYAAVASIVLVAILTTSFFVLGAAVVLLYAGRRSVDAEYDADVFAAAATTPETVCCALERLATLSHTPRNASRTFDFLVEHPSLDRRTEHLTTTLE